MIEDEQHIMKLNVVDEIKLIIGLLNWVKLYLNVTTQQVVMEMEIAVVKEKSTMKLR